MSANDPAREGGGLALHEKQILLSRLLARLAHEIRNPLSSLDIHVQLLEEDLAQAGAAVRERTAGRLEIIHGELHRLEHIVEQFLRLSGPSAVTLQPLDLARVAEHVCALLRPEAAARGIAIVLRVPAGLPEFPADSGQLTQALVNLILNAIQALGPGGSIEVTARADEAQDAMLLEVADTGPGIDAEKRAAIFEPFFTTKSEGSGLGLWIVQQIVIAHGGTVEVANRPDGGAVFTMQLPLRGKDASHAES
jgi:two-component system sensor histidine kinase HydH